MAYEVPDLPYDYSALEPHIDEQTMRLHHDKHHQTYVDKANAALEGTELADKPVEEVLQNLDQLPEDKRTPVRNNAGGHANHTFFWQIMSPDGGGEPSGALADAIDETFGGFDELQEADRTTPARTASAAAGPGSSTTARGSRSRARQPGLAGQRRPDAAAGRRRLGARLLPEVPEQAPGLHRRMVERRQLGRGREAVRERRLGTGTGTGTGTETGLCTRTVPLSSPGSEAPLNSSFDVTIEERGELVHVAMRGELDISTGARLEDELRRIESDAPSTIVLDLSGLDVHGLDRAPAGDLAADGRARDGRAAARARSGQRDGPAGPARHAPRRAPRRSFASDPKGWAGRARRPARAARRGERGRSRTRPG